MTDDQLLRYSRHILLDDIGIEGQAKLLSSHALIIGAGGLGSPAALYLGSAGVGRITVVDDDRVDATNLQRQIAHRLSRIGTNKAASVAQSIAEINPDVKVTALAERVVGQRLSDLVAQADVVLDCCDNFSTRQAINAACVTHRKALVSGAALRFDGQISVFDSRRSSSPCYACVFPPDAQPEEAQCATLGVFAPLVGMVGSMQAAEGLKLLLSVGESLAGKLLMLDGRSMRWSEIGVKKNERCSVCAGLM